MSQFKNKMTYEEFLPKREAAQDKLKINLSEELRYLNKWIKEYEELQ